jgi:hypothetical protein
MERGNITLYRIALMMEAARTSETLVNFYQTTRRYNPEDSHLCTHRRENLKSYNAHLNDLLRPMVEPKMSNVTTKQYWRQSLLMLCLLDYVPDYAAIISQQEET